MVVFMGELCGGGEWPVTSRSTRDPGLTGNDRRSLATDVVAVAASAAGLVDSRLSYSV